MRKRYPIVLNVFPDCGTAVSIVATSVGIAFIWL
jgi:hypothetical protein